MQKTTLVTLFYIFLVKVFVKQPNSGKFCYTFFFTMDVVTICGKALDQHSTPSKAKKLGGTVVDAASLKVCFW